MKKKNFKSLSLNRKTIANIEETKILGGSGVYCVTQEGSC
ncbi:hypothetical protein KAOT1_03347 [Kordia algicida OT-1]|uniref:Uncharacterized protein n=1 Tax=Kordia algicida OT-1 TaxID=391587 RepID=A9DVE9_9FLAO|nr:hypothetical protein KAOT1_03347 [Kordia algicida OT-1]